MKKKKVTNKNTKWVALITILVLLPSVLFVVEKIRTTKILEEVERAAFIVINKEDYSLKVFDYNGEKLFESGISCGKNWETKIKSEI